MTSKKRQPDQPSFEPSEASDPSPIETSSDRGDVLERLLDLAYDVSSYLRHQAQPTIRLSAALLLAASLAACGSSPSSAAPPVQPLSQEVRTGLPTQPGQYPVVAGSVLRDQQGVYHFQWMRPGQTSGGTQAAVSLLKLGQADTATLVIPQSGDPLLNLPPNTPIQLATAGGSATQRNPDYVQWLPFFGGGYYAGPRYYDPPVQTVPSSGTVNGSVGSVSPPSAAARTSGVSHAVSGQAGGVGSGSAATNKSGASAGVSGGKSGVSASSSSGFSGGKGASSSGGGGSSSS